MSDLPEWIKVGAYAVVLQPWERGSLTAKTVHIERITKALVIDSEEGRWRIASAQMGRLVRRQGGTWGLDYYLTTPDDPEVATTRRKIRFSNAKHAAMAASEKFRREPTIDTAARAMRAFDLVHQMLVNGDDA